MDQINNKIRMRTFRIIIIKINLGWENAFYRRDHRKLP